MSKLTTLLQLLSDGKFHSGQELGEKLGITRSAIWKYIHQLQSYYIDVYCVRGRGYCIPEGIELLNSTEIIKFLKPDVQLLISEIDIHQKIDSTNQYTLNKAQNNMQSGYLCLAEMQTAGRGRRHRHWFSPFGRNIYLSLLWNFSQCPQWLSGLTIAAGIAVVEALKLYGIDGLAIKWPNDIYWYDKKLGGILVEVFTDSVGTYRAVLGIGLNIFLPPEAQLEIEQPYIDIKTVIGKLPQRNKLIAFLINALIQMVTDYTIEGFKPYLQCWSHYDMLKGREVTVLGVPEPYVGVADGIDSNGGLLVRQAYDCRVFYSGEVSVRVKDKQCATNKNY